MKRKTITLQRAGIKERNICFVLIGLFILSLLPMIIISFFNVPSVDDFTYALKTHFAWNNTHSFGEVLKAAIGQTKLSYNSWQGTFSAIFLFTLQPGLFNDNLYFISTFILMGMLIGGVFFFYKVVLRNYLKTNMCTMVIISIVTLVLCMQFLPSAAQGFYWYNGAMYYTFFQSLLLFVIGLLLLNLKQQKIYVRIIYTILTCILVVLIGGGNFLTALLACVIMCIMIGYCIIDKKRRKKISIWASIIPPFIFLLVAFFINVKAPGNANRQAVLKKSSVIRTIINSFGDVMHILGTWTIVPVIIGIVFLIPFFIKIARNTNFKFKYPLVISIISIGFLTTMFCPPLYAMSNEGDKRTTNIIFYSLIILLVLNTMYYTGWILRRYEKYCEKHGTSSNQLVGDVFNYLKKHSIIGVTTVLLMFTITTVLVSETSLMGYTRVPATSYSAAKSLVNGEAKRYKEQADERLKLYNDDSIKDIRVAPFERKPYVLFFDDIQFDLTDWRNNAVVEYYNKNTVALENPS